MNLSFNPLTYKSFDVSSGSKDHIFGGKVTRLEKVCDFVQFIKKHNYDTFFYFNKGHKFQM